MRSRSKDNSSRERCRGIAFDEPRWVCASNAKSFPFAGGDFSALVPRANGPSSVNAHRARGAVVE
jgi:hypothetical protein